jgi:hypothetical protein
LHSFGTDNEQNPDLPTQAKEGDNCLVLSEMEGSAGIEILPETTDEPKIWFVMRDLKRSNAHLPAYKLLESLGVTYYTPMHWVLVTRGGQKKREYRPFIPDLLFVYETRKNLDIIVSKNPTLQYRFVKGGAYREAMVVPEAEMNRFMHAVGSVGNPRYYLPSEITPDMCKRRIRIVGGNLDGYEGRLLSVRGSRIKRLLVELSNYLVAAVEVNPEYIQLL